MYICTVTLTFSNPINLVIAERYKVQLPPEPNCNGAE